MIYQSKLESPLLWRTVDGHPGTISLVVLTADPVGFDAAKFSKISVAPIAALAS